MMSKCSRAGVAEIAVMEMSGKTRTRDGGGDSDEGGGAVKRRKLIRLRNSQIAESLDHHQHERASASCSGSSERIQFVDLEDTTSVETETSSYYSCRERREEEEEEEACCSESGGELDSTAEKSEANSRRRSKVEKMPTEDEIEEFFAKAEKQLQKEFADKYNYDIVKDEPMEGRYEWIRLESVKDN